MSAVTITLSREQWRDLLSAAYAGYESKRGRTDGFDAAVDPADYIDARLCGVSMTFAEWLDTDAQFRTAWA